MTTKRKLTYEMIENLDSKLDGIPLCKLPRIHTELNTGIWSVELGEPPTDYKKEAVCLEIIYLLKEIERRCGIKAIWRYEKVEKEYYTTQMFEDWWASTFIGGEPRNEFCERLGEKNGSEQGSDCKNDIKYVSAFLGGFFFASFLFLLIQLCT